ncbi:MAG: protein kinase [Thermoanaerobaculia bacterium]
MSPSGARFGPYEVLGELGSGGMGTVYRARDTRLGREVAVKVLREQLASDASAVARFEREARAVAALSHPNILAIHDFGVEGDAFYAVTELLRGETLRSRLEREALSWRKATEIAISIADGLAAAHAQGIVHRDLKPENVFLTEDGRVKILDFGLARQEPGAAAGAESALATVTATEPGTVMGTATYMSPEQVRGLPVDARSDIFSFGSVLYEMVTGRRAFPGKTAADSMAAILKDSPPDPSESGKTIPLALGRVITRCLEKAPDERFQSARDLTYALREIASTTGSAVQMSGVAATVPAAHRGRAVATAAGVVVLAAALLVVLDVGGVRNRMTVGARGTAIRSLAVLPLQNLSGDASQEYFADGMTEELIAGLARIGGLRVTSRTSVMSYRDTKKRLPEIARELGVDAVVEGSVSRADGKVRVTAQLIEAASDKHLWAQTYERDLRDVLALESEIAQAIAQAGRLELSPPELAQFAKSRRVAPAAFEAYVKGRYFWNKRGEENLKKAIGFFQGALDVDPAYAVAYSGIADSYTQLGYASLLAPREVFPKARSAAEKALELDATLAEPHASLAYVKFYFDWDWPGAEREFQRAIELNPNYATAHDWYAYLLTATGRLPEARAQIQRARELDPLSVPIESDMGFLLHYSYEQDRAAEELRKALEMNPEYPPAHFFLGRVYQAKGLYEQAIAEYQATGPLKEWVPTVAGIGYVYGIQGKRQEALQVLSNLEARSKKEYVTAYAVALVHAALGNKDQAFAWLGKGIEERTHWLVWLKRDLRWEPIRSDARFAELIVRIGLPPS